jgi:hypothetical protein
MFLSQLFESITPKHASFCFGRMNPPTVGHGQLINTVAKAARGGDYFIFVSQTQDKKKNPLDYATKIKFINALFPDQANHVVYDPELKTIMQIAQWLYNNDYRDVTFVAGSDRLESFEKLLNDYNGREGGNVYYKFDTINFVSSGERDPDADGIAGISASGAREAAVNSDINAFAQATGAGKLAQPLYDAVRKGMLLSDPELAEALQLGKLNSAGLVKGDRVEHNLIGTGTVEKVEGNSVFVRPDRNGPVARFALHSVKRITECSGYIPKNKKEAKDPRWSNSLTVDIKPGAINKNLKALRLI